MNIPWWAKHHAKYEIFEHRFCTNGKVVARCTHDIKRTVRGNIVTGNNDVTGRTRRFPCSACEKNKRAMRWSDYKHTEFRHKGVMKKEKQKIADLRWQQLQEEVDKHNRPLRDAARFQAELFRRIEETPNDPKLIRLLDGLRELGKAWRDEWEIK